MRKTQVPALVALAVWFVAALAGRSDDAAGLRSKVSIFLSRFPAASAADRDRLAAEILELGPAAVAEVCGRVLPPGEGDDSVARYALNGLAIYAARPGGENDRRLVSRAILDATARVANKEVKAFLISQVQLAGGREAVKPLAAYLADERLAEPAAQALLAIRAPGTDTVFLRALEAAPAAARVTIVKALGELRSRTAARKLIPMASSPDDRLRQTALYALANIGDPAAGPVLERTRVAAPLYERSQAPVLYLLYARRLVESGKAPEGLTVCRSILRYYAAPAESHIAANALGLIVSTLKDGALPDLLAAMDSPSAQLRGAALELATSLAGSDATRQWVVRAAGASPEVRAEIIGMLGRRGDRTALPEVRQALRSPDKAVRLAAVPAAVRLGGADVLPNIYPLFRSPEVEDVAAARDALLGFEAGRVVPDVVRLIETTPPAGRAALIDVLAAKGASDQMDLVFTQARSPEPAVRAAAIAALAGLGQKKDLERLLELLYAASDSEETVNLQKAVAAAASQDPDPERRADGLISFMGGVDAAHKAAILKVLPRLPGAHALRTAADAARDKDSVVQAAAVYALSQWPDFKAADELVRIVSTTTNKKFVLMALEGYVRLINRADVPAFKRLDLLRGALALAKDDTGKKVVLRAVAENREPAAFRMLADSLGNKELRLTAVQALLAMASEQAPEERWLSGHEAISILRRVEAGAEDPAEKERASRTISDRLRQGGFVLLFNGRDLDGWKGLVADPPARARMTSEELKKDQAAADERMRAHWRVVDGLLVFDGKGENLCTLKDYGDFEMLVDWKIEKGGDSGIYLRGSPQVQIWDPIANPEGSGGLYNNQKEPSHPLEKADRPVGEWNTYRIIMIGERVTVYLNDRMVVDNTVLENYWERDKPIYPVGQIELQAHGGPLWFRNIYVREIPRDTAVSILAGSERDEDFVPLFNGRDLTGWTGDTKGYQAENGCIVVHPELGGGNLYTEKEYGDFILRFDFRLTPAANNGIGVRAPLEGDAAYTGMEIQVLDDGSPVYWDLQPYQYHGSIYGVVPARRGVLRPVGEWNSEEITAPRRRITVTVNGIRVVDADLDEASGGGTVDHRDHPGLKRERGHIGFLGHGSIVEFRNVRVKELK
jgi:HEAT repeat protein